MLGYLILPHVQVQERDDSASGVQAVITSNKKRKKAHPVQVQERDDSASGVQAVTSNKKRKKAHPVQVQERDPDAVREETEVIR